MDGIPAMDLFADPPLRALPSTSGCAPYPTPPSQLLHDLGDSATSAPCRQSALVAADSPEMNPTFNSSGESLDDYKFSFESYLDHSKKIEADPNPWTDEIPDTASVTQSIYEFQKENGRTYHAYRAGSYHYPNDEVEIDRLETQYDILKIILGGRSYLSPWSKKNPPNKVLDIATGSGCWAVDMGDEFPDAKIIGTDLSPIQHNLVPPNVQFIIDDATDEWPDGEEWHDFDFIHTRATLGCWSDMLSQVIRPAFERLRPGGWMESQEIMGLLESDDNTINENNAFKKWCDDIVSASTAANRPIDFASNLKTLYAEAGFVDVQEKVYKIPMNGWPRVRKLKRLGEMWHMNMSNGLQGFSYALLHRVRGMSKEEIELSLVDVRKDLADKRQHTYERFYVVWGRKPENATPSRSETQDEVMTGC